LKPRVEILDAGIGLIRCEEQRASTPRQDEHLLLERKTLAKRSETARNATCRRPATKIGCYLASANIACISGRILRSGREKSSPPFAHKSAILLVFPTELLALMSKCR
jgi:hypothetical protein